MLYFHGILHPVSTNMVYRQSRRRVFLGVQLIYNLYLKSEGCRVSEIG